MLIIITGVPGTGKTVIADELAKKANATVVHITDFVNKHKLGITRNREKIVDIKKLERALKHFLAERKDKRRDLIIEGHLACEIKLKADHVFVLRSHPNVLEKRLKMRGYNNKKIADNVLAEMLDYCVIRARLNYGNRITELDTAKRTRAESVNKILQTIRNKSKHIKIDKVDYHIELLNYIKSNQVINWKTS